MQNELESIRVGYETLGLSPEQIADDRKLEVTAVKSALLNCSPKYRNDCKLEEPGKSDINFSDEQHRAVVEEIFRVAVYGEDEGTRLKAAMYIRDDKKGRRELRQVLGGNTFNILAFNQNMQRIRESAERMKQQVLDVKEVV